MSLQAWSRQVVRLTYMAPVAGFFFFLTSCGPSEILYIDPVTRLAAPEISAAWSSAGMPSAIVKLTQNSAAEISADLRQRKPAPQGVLVAAAVPNQQLVQWQKEFPKTRFVVLRATGLLPAVAHFEATDPAAWKALARQAALDALAPAQAVAVVGSQTKPDLLQALQDGWRDGGQSSLIDVVLWDSRLAVPDSELRRLVSTATTDLFVLGVDPTRVSLPVEASQLRIHRDAAWTASEISRGWQIRLSPSRLAPALHDALRQGAPEIVYLPWEIVPKTPFSRS